MLEATWRPDGGPEAHRAGLEYSENTLSRFRAHEISAGHQKWPDQTREKQDGWYVRPPRATALKELRVMRDAFRAAVSDKSQFDRLVEDDGRCGGAEWFLDGQRVTSTSIWSAYYACRLLELCPDATSVVDIGGGYGHLAHVLAEFYPTVTLVDLPEVLRLAARWTDKVALVDPGGDWHGDLVINTMSFQHMTPANLAFYDARLRTQPPRWIYLVNRTVVKDPTDTPMQSFPFLDLFQRADVRKVGAMHIEWFGEQR